jgi:hypothetical protein
MSGVTLRVWSFQGLMKTSTTVVGALADNVNT